MQSLNSEKDEIIVNLNAKVAKLEEADMARSVSELQLVARMGKLFNHLVNMLKTQQTQLESLVADRKLLQAQIQVQYDRYVSEVRILVDQMSQINKDVTMEEMVQLKKICVILGFKQRESFLYKRRSDNAQDDLQDYRSYCSHLLNLLKCKNNEVLEGNEKIRELLASMEKMQSLNGEKDEAIVNLKAKVAKLEEDMIRSNSEISTQSKELQRLRMRKSRKTSSTTATTNAERRQTDSKNIESAKSETSNDNNSIRR
ncbi:hypothetical protein MKW94_014338 [Papaver nudicaule]|uniref:Uncharacterized protein n=1 Tax=Papaver nudicaule TaxID=74823 RepID=A0AA41V5Q6_PAPNU|nr:hypothetical protein [Papaver nudicaule]